MHCHRRSATRVFGYPLAACVVGALLSACLGRSNDRESDHRASPHSTRYFSVPEQIQIGEAAGQLWTGVCLGQSWDDAAKRIVEACGGSLRYDEAFLLASYHPRALSETAWRADFERAIGAGVLSKWNPSPEPVCTLIREAILMPGREAAPLSARASRVVHDGDASERPERQDLGAR